MKNVKKKKKMKDRNKNVDDDEFAPRRDMGAVRHYNIMYNIVSKASCKFALCQKARICPSPATDHDGAEYWLIFKNPIRPVQMRPPPSRT